MKKWICVITALLLTLAFASCSSVDTATADEGTASESIVDASKELTATEAKAVRDRDAVYEYEEREIWCENNGNRIYGKAFIPIIDGVSKFPLVIHSHGMGSNHEAGEGYCKRYAEKGFAGYTFDFPGGSKPATENKSDGDPMEMSPVTEASDLQAILDTALTWDFVDTDYVFLEGGSQGGLVTTMIGLDNTDKVRGMILHYPSLYMPQIITSFYDSPDEVPDTLSFDDDYELSGKFARDLFGVDVISRLNEFENNVVIIQGSEDHLVAAEMIKEASELFPNAEFHLIEGAGHGFGGDDFETAVRYGLDYLFENT